MTVIAVIGSRNFSDYSFFAEKLEYLLQNLSDYSFVSGGALGADSLCRRYCQENSFKLVEHLPNYDKYPPKAAPIIRNKLIINDATHLICFWDGISKGSKSAIKMAEKKGIKIKIITI